MHTSPIRCVVSLRLLIACLIIGCTAALLTALSPTGQAVSAAENDATVNFRLQRARAYLNHAEVSLKLAESANRVTATPDAVPRVA